MKPAQIGSDFFQGIRRGIEAPSEGLDHGPALGDGPDDRRQEHSCLDRVAQVGIASGKQSGGGLN